MGGTYAVYSKVTKKKKKKVKTKNGNELPGQQFDESGRCINEDDVLSRAANSGQIPSGNQSQAYGSGAPMNQQYGSQPQYGAPPMNQGYGAPPMQYGSQPNFGAPPMNQGYGAPPMQPGYGAPPMNPYVQPGYPF